MGIGAGLVRTVGMGIIGTAVLMGGNYLVDIIRNNDSAPVAQGYANYKLMSVEPRKNEQGSTEALLNYKIGDNVISLPCKLGPQGPLCGEVSYWWQGIGAEQRKGLVQSEWGALDGSTKHGLVKPELDAMIEQFYNQVQKPQQSSRAK